MKCLSEPVCQVVLGFSMLRLRVHPDGDYGYSKTFSDEEWWSFEAIFKGIIK